ncbi:hypothetical protein ACHAW5_003306 [Stephanodiscus triporus]|uniref:Uncharacterized protein n=1 Tax=Stephanodiscus triporus TaxID=2934178 RepID=A0ABD3QBX6_9STRA
MRGSAAGDYGNRHPPSSRNNIRNRDDYGPSCAMGGRGGGGSRGGWQRGRNGGGNGGGGFGRRSNGNGAGCASSSWDSRRGGGGREGGVNGNPIARGTAASSWGAAGGGDDDDCDYDYAAAAPPDTEPALRVLSFYEHGSRIAFACYAEDDNEIVFEDVRAHTGSDTERVVRGVLSETRPNLILVSNKVVANVPLLECLTARQCGGDGVDSGGEGGRGHEQVRDEPGPRPVSAIGGIPYQLLKSSAFEPRQCRSVILNQLRVLTLMRNGHPTTADGQRDGFDITRNYTTAQRHASNFHSLSSMIDFESPTLVRALGSLLIYLRNTAFRLEEGFTVTVNDLRRCHAPDSFLRLDESTLRTLRIFASDRRPKVAAKAGGGGGKNDRNRSKESFSIFALLDRTRSKAGRERLRRWMEQPLRDAVKIRERHAGMELFLHPESRPAVSLIIDRLSAVGSMDSILLRMQRCCAAQPNDFLALIRMLDASQAIIATLGGDLRDKAYKLDEHVYSVTEQRQQEQQQQQLQQYPSVAYIDDLLRRCHVPVIRNLRERMAFVIDEDVTAEAKDHVVIHYGFNDELDRAKETFETLDDTLSEVGRQVLSKHHDLNSLKVVFLPQVGFLISLDKRQHAHDEATNTFPNIPEDFEFVFLQDNDAFFKSDEMNQLDEEIGDLDAFIKDTEALIVSDLEEEVLECESELRSTFSALADMDCIISLAGCAADLNFIRPDIVSAEEGVIEIENGRHPLQELIVDDEFIPNDTMMNNNNRVMIVTGPNFSGKSCYARQVGVLVYLAHIGSYLPCDSAKISVMDQIIVNFGEVETCSVPQSTFQRDMTQMAGIMRKSTPNTLVLIDEFGKGKFESLLKHFLVWDFGM